MTTKKNSKKVVHHHLSVRYAETDASGYVYHSRYFEWFEASRTEFLHKLGKPYTYWEEKGLFLPIVEAYCRYHQPAKYDDKIVIDVWLSEKGAATLTMKYYVWREGVLLAEGYTRHGLVDKDNRPRRFPFELSGILQKALIEEKEE